jgi:hypothetical protein
MLVTLPDLMVTLPRSLGMPCHLRTPDRRTIIAPFTARAPFILLGELWYQMRRPRGSDGVKSYASQLPQHAVYSRIMNAGGPSWLKERAFYPVLGHMPFKKHGFTAEWLVGDLIRQPGGAVYPASLTLYEGTTMFS